MLPGLINVTRVLSLDTILGQLNPIHDIKFPREISRINIRLKTNVFETSSVFVIRVDVRSDHNSPIFISVRLVDKMVNFGDSSHRPNDGNVSETFVFKQTLTQLIARENLIPFIRRGSFKSYIV
jgi:hypothetical protein